MTLRLISYPFLSCVWIAYPIHELHTPCNLKLYDIGLNRQGGSSMQKMLLLVGKVAREGAPVVSFATMLAFLALSTQAQANPTINNVSASSFGALPGYVSGQVSGVNPADYKVAVL